MLNGVLVLLKICSMDLIYLMYLILNWVFEGFVVLLRIFVLNGIVVFIVFVRFVFVIVLIIFLSVGMVVVRYIFLQVVRKGLLLIVIYLQRDSEQVNKRLNFDDCRKIQGYYFDLQLYIVSGI